MTHHHGHSHNDVSLTQVFRMAIVLNTAYVLIEAAIGLSANSLSLLADAAHNLGDVAGLLLAWGAMFASRQGPRQDYTYGYGRATLLAALINAVTILVGVALVVWTAINRFSEPQTMPAELVMATAMGGIIVNGWTAKMLSHHRSNDMNLEGAFLHMVSDVAVSVGVVLGAFVVWQMGWQWVDPAIAIVVSLVVAKPSYDLLRSSLSLVLDGVPSFVDSQGLTAFLLEQSGVAGVHDLHIWALSTTKAAMTVHLEMPLGAQDDAFLEKLTTAVAEKFGIAHATFQVETHKQPSCNACCVVEAGGAHEEKHTHDQGGHAHGSCDHKQGEPEALSPETRKGE